MIRILLVEDDPPTLDALELLLKKEFPEALIHTATNVANALNLIQAALLGPGPYDSAILDVMLPRAHGEHPELDRVICSELRQKSQSTVVFHITAYADEPLVNAHLGEFHSREEDPRAYWYPKEKGWETELIQALKARIYGRPIRAELRDLFGPPVPDAPGSREAVARPSGFRRGLTHRLAELTRNIEAHWDDLDDRLQDEIRQHFHVDPEGEGQWLATLKR